MVERTTPGGGRGDAAPPNITEESIAAIAEEAHAHVRTVERRLLGLNVKGKVARRVDDAIARRGVVVRVVVDPARSAAPRSDGDE